MTVLSVAFFAATLTNSVRLEDTYSLKWMPKKGDKTAFTLNVKTLDKKNPMEIEANLEQVVLKVERDSYETATENKGTLLRLAGEEIRDARAQKTTVVFSPLGVVKKLKDGFPTTENDVWMFSVVRAFIAPEAPVSIGGQWAYEYEPVDFHGARLAYSLKSVTDGVATVDFTIFGGGNERPKLGEGAWEIDAKTGSWKSMKCHVLELFDSGKAGTDISLKRN